MLGTLEVQGSTAHALKRRCPSSSLRRQPLHMRATTPCLNVGMPEGRSCRNLTGATSPTRKQHAAKGRETGYTFWAQAEWLHHASVVVECYILDAKTSRTIGVQAGI